MTWWDRAVVINLPERTSRLEGFAEEAARVGIEYEVFEATRTSPGQLGCMDAHAKVLLSVKHDETVAIFEDDAVFTQTFVERMGAFMSAIPRDWQCLWLGGRHRVPPIPIHPGVVRPVTAHRSHAYVVRRAVARPLSFAAVKSVIANDGRHFDHIAAEALREEPGVYSPDPWLVGQNAGQSDITDGFSPIRWL